jgi:hypothetical protein
MWRTNRQFYDAGHAFPNDRKSAYNEAAAELEWTRGRWSFAPDTWVSDRVSLVHDRWRGVGLRDDGETNQSVSRCVGGAGC